MNTNNHLLPISKNPISREEFETNWPQLDKELRQEMEDEAASPGSGDAPAGGLSMNFDSLSAVNVVEVIIPKYLKESPPGKKIIRKGGYETVDDFISGIKPKLIAFFCKD